MKLSNAPPEITTDINVVKAVLLKTPDALQFADRDIVLEFVESDGSLLQHAGAFRNDRDVVNAALRNTNDALQFADRDIVLEFVESDGFLLKHAGAFHNDRDVVKAALDNNPDALQFADKSIVLEFVKENGLWLQHAGKFRADREIVMAAFEQRRQFLEFADPRIVLDLVTENGLLLEFTGKNYQNDSDIVNAAFEQDPTSLTFASEEIVSCTVRKNGLALQYASDDVKMNFNIALQAVKQNGHAIRFADPSLHSQLSPDSEFQIHTALKAMSQKMDTEIEKATPGRLKIYNVINADELDTDVSNQVDPLAIRYMRAVTGFSDPDPHLKDLACCFQCEQMDNAFLAKALDSCGHSLESLMIHQVEAFDDSVNSQNEISQTLEIVAEKTSNLRVFCHAPIYCDDPGVVTQNLTAYTNIVYNSKDTLTHFEIDSIKFNEKETLQLIRALGRCTKLQHVRLGYEASVYSDEYDEVDIDRYFFSDEYDCPRDVLDIVQTWGPIFDHCYNR